MGISPVGWLHTLGSLPAVPLTVYTLVERERIAPETAAGRAYFAFMLLGVLTIYTIAHEQTSSIVATVTLALLLLGYGISSRPHARRATKYVETVSLSITVFLLLAPSVSGTLRRLPVGDPIAKGLKDPILLGAQGSLLLALVIGIALQVRALCKCSAPTLACADIAS